MNNREVEKKFVVKGLTYEEAYAVLRDRYACRIDATSYDLYWAAPNVDFIRLRENSRELTVKVTDMGTVTDRIEENIVLEKDSMPDATRAMKLLYGEPMKLIKTFSVFDTLVYKMFAHEYGKVVICLYQVYGDPQRRVFLEVEATGMNSVDTVVTSLENKLDLEWVPYSLYQIFKDKL